MSRPVYVSAFGEVKSLAEWSRDSRCRVPYQALVERVSKLGYPPEHAITKPKSQGFKKRSPFKIKTKIKTQ
jgi:hypothetical protein